MQYQESKVKLVNNFYGEVVDIFCGIGALSHGFKLAGFDIRAGYDIESTCEFAYEFNNNATFINKDIRDLQVNEVKKQFTGKLPSIMIGCAPCQPFSTYRYRYKKDPQYSLVDKFAKLAIEVQPDYISMENVPTLVSYDNGNIFKNFIANLERANYSVSWEIVRCEKFGIPQNRRRLVVIASKYNVASIPTPPNITLTVRDAIESLNELSAGQTDSDDRLHKSRSLTHRNMKRIKASKPGGNWKDWPINLRADCHKRKSGKTYTSVYARMEWDKPSPTITTQFIGFGNGRFGHPKQDRAISLREGAILQSFPHNYKFHSDQDQPNIQTIARWIGNAVPVKLAEAIAKHIAAIEKGEQSND